MDLPDSWLTPRLPQRCPMKRGSAGGGLRRSVSSNRACWTQAELQGHAETVCYLNCTSVLRSPKRAVTTNAQIMANARATVQSSGRVR